MYQMCAVLVHYFVPAEQRLILYTLSQMLGMSKEDLKSMGMVDGAAKRLTDSLEVIRRYVQ